MKIRYKGGRTWYEVVYNRTPYCFTKENNFTCEITSQAIVNYIFGLSNHAEFEAVMELKAEQPKEEVMDTKPEPKKLGRPKKGGK